MNLTAETGPVGVRRTNILIVSCQGNRLPHSHIDDIINFIFSKTNLILYKNKKMSFLVTFNLRICNFY